MAPFSPLPLLPFSEGFQASDKERMNVVLEYGISSLIPFAADRLRAIRRFGVEARDRR
jgi:hypothetical protein